MLMNQGAEIVIMTNRDQESLFVFSLLSNTFLATCLFVDIIMGYHIDIKAKKHCYYFTL